MKRTIFAGAAACLILGAMSATASAAIVDVTYTGKIASGTDGLGIFTTAGQSLQSLPFTMTFVFDTSINRVQGTAPVYDVSYGGSYYHLTSPLQSATLTINGASQAIDGSVISDIGYFAAFPPGYYETTAIGNPFTNTAYGTLVYSDVVMGNFVQPDFSSIDTSLKESHLTGGITLDGSPTNYSGYFDLIASGGAGAFTSGRFASGVALNVSSSTGTFPGGPVPGVPEPATWGMMILGFGFIGAVQRRRARARIAYAFA